MARRRRRSYRTSIGHERARKHIQEAREFSDQMGGTDKDVKEYFFSLSNAELESILTEYKEEHGSSAANYARETMGDWKAGRRKMSGMVAKRLFDLLPPRMPIKKKFELAENIWKHFGPSSRHSYIVGPEARVGEVISIVSETLDKQITEYNIPQNVKNRFNWLASNDVGLKEQLLNHFRQLEKDLVKQKLEAELPILQSQMRAHADKTGSVRSVLTINKHEVSVWVDAALGEEVQEGMPVKQRATIGSGAAALPWGWIIVATIAGVLLFLR